MKMNTKQKIISILFAFILIWIVGCSSGNDDEASDGTDTTGNDSVAESVDENDTIRPEGWTEATHSKNVDPDYDVVFEEGTVKRIDITIDASDWQAMMDDMEVIYGEFGVQSQGGPLPAAGELGNNIEGAPVGPIDGTEGEQPPVGMPPTEDIANDTNPMWAPCTFRFNDKTWYYVGIRFKGNSSLRDSWQSGNLKLPFRFDFDQFEDDYPEIDNQRFYGFKKLSLSSNYHDESFIREKVVADLFRDAGVPAPRTSFYRLYIDNGEGSTYFGLYTMVEIPDAPMLSQQFEDDDGNLYKSEGTGATFAEYDEAAYDKKTNEDEADFSDINALYTALHADPDDAAAWRAGLEHTFDVDGFIRWLAVNTLVQNWDTYGQMSHNYYLYNDPGDGLIHWIPWDNNESLNGTRRQPLSLALTPEEVGDGWPLIRYLMDDDHYFATYVAYVNEIASGEFAPERMQTIYAQAHELVRPYVVGTDGEIEGYSHLGNSENFETALEYLNTHVEARYDAAMAFVADNQ